MLFKPATRSGAFAQSLAKIAGDLRRVSHRLHPSGLEDLGLEPALESLVRDFGQQENMITTFMPENVPGSLPIETSTGVYRIAQEALRNVAKHAGRTHVKVNLRGARDSLELQVRDAGLGFDPADGRSGLGLISMEERARLMGATLQVWSALGKGTTVTVTVPIREDRPQATETGPNDLS